MASEWKLSSTIQAGGKVEVLVPSLPCGQVVEVSVRVPAPTARDNPGGQRPVGILKGKVRMAPSFDEQLEEFEPYI